MSAIISGISFPTIDGNGDIVVDGFVKHSSQTSITASTTQLQGQQTLSREFNSVGTVANANDVVTLPTAIVGRRVTVMNNGANVLKIFPPSGCNLGEGLDSATTLQPTELMTFFCVSSVRYFTESVGPTDFPLRSVRAGITASTTQTQGQQTLTKEVNSIGTVANANDVVTLPSVVGGMQVSVINNGANTLQIFPYSGDNLGNGGNIPTTLAVGGAAVFVGLSTILWKKIN